jgi:putative glutathione S-transferase
MVRGKIFAISKGAPTFSSLSPIHLRRLADYHNLQNRTREIYQMPGVAGTVEIPGIKLGYCGGMRHISPGGIPLGPDLDFAAPRDRGQFAKAA